MIESREWCEPSPPVGSPLTVLEAHSGMITGYSQESMDHPRWSGVDADPRVALEAVIRPHLVRGDCVVRFSGGRDSSLILAVAAHVARRDGLPMPAAFSVRYPAVQATDESAWQDLVARHLGIPLDVIEVPDGGDDLAGPLAVDRLSRDGVSYPPASAVSFARMADVVGGRTVLTGEGGDEVLGGSRITTFTAHWRRRRRPDRTQVRQMGRELCPRGLRRQLVRQLVSTPGRLSWVRPDLRAAIFENLVSDHLDQPWDWREARWKFLRSRMCLIGFESMRLTARREGFTIVHPLIEARFVSALAASAGHWGLVSRGDAMRLLADDLLPAEVLARTSKASFNGAYAGPWLRSFARSWDGSGVDAELVDIETLRSAWLADEVPAQALSPLQLALSAAVADGWAPEPRDEASR